MTILHVPEGNQVGFPGSCKDRRRLQFTGVMCSLGKGENQRNVSVCSVPTIGSIAYYKTGNLNEDNTACFI